MTTTTSGAHDRHLEPNGRTLDALSRATDVLAAHPELPPITVSTNPLGQVTFLVSAADTADEDTRRAAVDVLAAAVGLDQAVSDGLEYRARSRTWRVSTLVHARCCTCGQVRP